MKLISNPVNNAQLSAMDSMYPTEIFCKTDSCTLKLSPFDTVYGICLEAGPDTFVQPQDYPAIKLLPGTVFSVPTLSLEISISISAKIYFIVRRGYRSLFGVSQLEDRGRLAYIDGCTDSLLLPPARMGDPCLNSLHFPPGINQTQHLHPDIRVGVVMSGSGIAYREGHWEKPLRPGSMFILEESQIHSFKTNEEQMTVVAYHPTTDTGPTDQAHAMISRTYINHGKG